MMDCLDARSIASMHLDGARIEPDRLKQAQQHCKECSECTEFIHALRAMHAATTPEPPADLADRVMARVAAVAREEAAAKGTATPAQPATVGASVSKARTRQEWTRWIAAAAAVFIVAGFGAVMGVRQILGPPQPPVETMMVTSDESAASISGQRQAAESAQKSSEDAYSMSAATDSSVAPPSAITVDGVVFIASGEASVVDTSTMSRIATTMSSLSQDTAASKNRDVFAASDRGRVYVAADSGGYLAFTRVTRTYEGTTYALMSGALSSFGVWPTLPTGITAPTSPDGTPTFVLAGGESQGQTAYRKTSASAAAGIAIAPGTPSTDPAAGNPSWTWWEPVR